MSEDVLSGAPSAPTIEAEPSTPLSAADQAAVSGDVRAFREARRAERAGAPLSPSPADSASAAPDVQAASTDATPAPASEPGKPTGHKGNADTRIAELLAERAQLRRELEQRRAPTPAETKPAAPSPAPVKADSDDPEPQLADFEADPAKYPDPYTAHLRALARWEGRQEIRQVQAAERQRAETARLEQAETARLTAFQGRMKEAIAKEPAFLDGISDDVKGLKTIAQAQAAGEAPTALNAVAEELLDSPVAPQLMRHFTDHPEDLRRLADCPTPKALLKELGKLEARIEAGPTPTPPKRITDAPPPPTTLGRTVTEPADAEVAAARAGDMTAFKAARRRTARA